ncbi:VirB4 family type IV secretion/conjugal transfer ATPase [Enterobacter cloacae]|uniref:VirB4 family type IV secretion/conjugal transfer ATPase n=1 Tax=Enterobacter cloacae TaxID=550 RepID=UPI00388DB00D
MGMHHCSVMVSAPEIKEVRKRLVSVTNDLSSHGLIMKQCTKSLEATFLGAVPATVSTGLELNQSLRTISGVSHRPITFPYR